jgi:hypothetical protein
MGHGRIDAPRARDAGAAGLHLFKPAARMTFMPETFE